MYPFRVACLLLALLPAAVLAGSPGGGRHGPAATPDVPGAVPIEGQQPDVSWSSINLALLFPVGDRLEFGVTPTLYARLSSDTDGGENYSASGTGDVRASLRFRINEAAGAKPGMTFGAGFTLPSGDDAISIGDETFDAGLSVSWESVSGKSLSFFAGGSRNSNWQSTTLAVSWSVPVSNKVEGYLEADVLGGDAAGTLAGGGVSWYLSPRLAFDAHLLAGIDDDAPQAFAGAQLSWWFD